MKELVKQERQKVIIIKTFLQIFLISLLGISNHCYGQKSTELLTKVEGYAMKIDVFTRLPVSKESLTSSAATIKHNKLSKKKYLSLKKALATKKSTDINIEDESIRILIIGYYNNGIIEEIAIDKGRILNINSVNYKIDRGIMRKILKLFPVNERKILTPSWYPQKRDGVPYI